MTNCMGVEGPAHPLCKIEDFHRPQIQISPVRGIMVFADKAAALGRLLSVDKSGRLNSLVSEGNAMNRYAVRSVVLLFVGIILEFPAVGSAQETTTSTKTPTAVTRVVTIETAQVVYVSGDDVVLKDAAGRLRLLALPAGTPLIVDGKPTAVKDLTPGTTLGHVQARTRVDSEVTTVTQIDGEIVHVTPPKWVTIRLGEGTVKRYEIPAEATFQVNGATATPFELKKGMKLSATAVTTGGLNTHTSKSAVVGETPPQVGALLIFRGR